MIGAIEAGGTKIVCATGRGNGNESPEVLSEVRFPTTSPAETIACICDFFRRQQNEKGEKLSAIGIGTFGPADINPASPAFGSITTTPKQGWQHTNIVRPLIEEFQVPVAFDTDVNAAVIGEGRWGAAKDVDDYIYITVGTGIGGGVVSGGRVIHGRMHPEIGHLLLPRNSAFDPFEGCCPFHGDCFEGLASGPAMAKRWRVESASELPPEHEAWKLQAHYLALACVNLTVTLSPSLIILGGGVMEQWQLFPIISAIVKEKLNGYLIAPEIVPPGLGNKAGILGAFAMALEVAAVG